MILFFLALLGVMIGLGLVFLGSPTSLVIPFVLVLFVLSLVSPFVVILLLLGITPLRILWLAGGIAPQELLYSLTFLCFLGFSFLRQFLRRPSGSRPAWDTPIALPIFCMGLVGAWGAGVAILRGHPFAHWASDFNFILFFWLYFVVTTSLKDTRDIYKVFWPSLWVTAGVVIWGILWRVRMNSVYAGIAPGFPRGMAFSSTFFVLSVCLFLFSDPGSLRRKGLFLISLFFGLHQFLSFVRVTWISQIGTAGFLLMTFPVSAKRRFLRWVGGVFIITSLIFIISWILPTDNQFVKTPMYVMNRFMSIFTDTTGAGATMRTRYSEWEAALKKYAEHPLVGNGLGTQIQFTRYDYASLPPATERYIHSSYIYYLLNTGPFGLLLFLWFCWRAFRYGMGVYQRVPLSELKGLALGFTASLVFQIFSSIAGNELNNPSRTIWTGFFLGALAVIDHQAKH